MNRATRCLISGAASVCAAIAVVFPGAAQASSGQSAATAGVVNFVKRTASADTSYLNAPTSQIEEWVNRHFWRAEVFSPYFDSKTSWYHHGWAYTDLYAIYQGSSFASEHPSWILHNASGERLYIPWGCSGGTCPQYAGDVGNPEYRHAWIANAKAAVAHGYAGLWIDDVNLVFDVGNGSGAREAPVDPRTGKPMTEQAWEEYVVTFVEEIRAALPSVEILHNSVWYAGGAQRWNNPLVKREIAAANYINLERGVNDPNIKGGSGEWSLSAVMSFVDSVHAAGKGVILDGSNDSPQGREYSLAAYFLVSMGDDGVGNGEMTPENWWSAYEIDLGEAEGQRSAWQGLMRRNFTGGIALLNEPEAPTRTVTLPRPMLTTAGTLVGSITLPASSGAVLRYPGGSAEEGPFGGRPPQEQPEESPAGTEPAPGKENTLGAASGETSGASGETTTIGAAAGANGGDPGAGEGKTTGAGSRPGGSSNPLLEALLSLKARRLRRAVTLLGRLRLPPAQDVSAEMHVDVSLQRLQGSSWRRAGTLRVPLRLAGRFDTTIRHLSRGHYRAEASLSGAGTRIRGASSAPLAFSLQ
jgi:hypothetical protein